MAHFDLEQAERQMRSALQKVTETADAAVARGDAEQDFILAQRSFDEPRMQFMLSALRHENEGAQHRTIMMAAAAQLGTLMGSLFNACEGDQEEVDFLDWVERAFADTTTGGVGGSDGITATTDISPMPSGRA
jgi:hypothetical protein